MKRIPTQCLCPLVHLSISESLSILFSFSYHNLLQNLTAISQITHILCGKLAYVWYTGGICMPTVCIDCVASCWAYVVTVLKHPSLSHRAGLVHVVSGRVGTPIPSDLVPLSYPVAFMEVGPGVGGVQVPSPVASHAPVFWFILFFRSNNESRIPIP